MVCDGYWIGELFKFCRPHVVENGADRTKPFLNFSLPNYYKEQNHVVLTSL